MDAATPAPAATPAASPTPLTTAWPRSAQVATATLLGLAVISLGVRSYGCLRWGTRPSSLVRATDFEHRIDLNRADRAELLQLPGVGENLVGRIEDYRHEH